MKKTWKKKRLCRAVFISSVLAGMMLAVSCGKAGPGNGSAQLESKTGSSVSEEAKQPAEQDVPDWYEKGADNAVPSSEKTESVHISADASGMPEKITVEDTLKHPSEGTCIRDFSMLTEISNQRGDEEYAAENPQGNGAQQIIWQNAGEDITYQGTANEELPVQVRVSYYLDGQEMSPEQIAGKSGRVRICFFYKNQEVREETVDGTTERVTVPFVVLSMMTLPDDRFTNVEVDNGKLMTLGDRNMVIGYAFPGLKSSLQLKDLDAAKDMEIPDRVEVEADVSEFSLDYTAHIIMNGLLKDVDLDGLEEISDMTDGIDELQKASRQLVKGMEALNAGEQAFGDYLKQYTEGAKQLDAGIQSLSRGVGEMDDTLQETAKELGEVLDDWENMIGKVQKELQKVSWNEEADHLAKQAAGISKSLEEAREAVDAISPDQISGDEAAAAETAASQAAAAAEKAISESDLTQEQKEVLSEAVTDGIRDGIDLSGAFSEENKEALKTAKEAVATLQEAYGSLQESSKELEKDLKALGGEDGPFASLMEGELSQMDEEDLARLKELKKKIETTSLQEMLAEGMPEEEFEEALKKLEETDWDAVIQDGFDQQTKMTDDLREAILQAAGGIHQMREGTDALSKGSAGLAGSGTELSDGYGELEDGMEELLSGMQAFDREGISKLSELAGDDLVRVSRRIRAVQAADRDYTNYSGIADETDGSVRFTLETEKIVVNE